MNGYRILLSGDANSWCESLAVIFNKNPNYHIVDIISPEVLIEAASRLLPDILIWKLESENYMPLLIKIKSQCPSTQLITLVEDPNSINVRELVGYGVRSCLPLRLFPCQIANAVELIVEAGIMCLPRPNMKDRKTEVSRNYLPVFDSLSNREREVIAMLLGRSSNQEIAAALCLSESTIKSHLHNIYQKVGARNRNEARAKLCNYE
jgi:DNA-binding NarL/FixJ family response regulator